MTDEVIALCKKLKVPLLTAAEHAALEQLQKEWKHWENREQQLLPNQILVEQKLAYTAFLDSPTAENEQRLAVLADPILTGTRHALLRRAFMDLRRRITKRAGETLHRFLDQASKALNEEHTHRFKTGQPVMSNIQNNPAVKETRRAIEQIDRMSSDVFHAIGSKSDKSPLELADGLV